MNDSNQPTNIEALPSEPQISNNTTEETAVIAEAVPISSTDVAVAKDAEGVVNSPEVSPKVNPQGGRDSARGGQARPERPERPEREKVDRAELRAERIAEANEVAEKAWKLYSGEIEEEGIELIDDSDAEKLAQRCFKIAEIFVKTRIRRLNQVLNGVGQEENMRPNQNQGQRQNQSNQAKGGQGQQNQSSGQRSQNQAQGQKQSQRQSQPNQAKGGQNNGQNQPKQQSEQPPASSAIPNETTAAAEVAAPAPVAEKSVADVPANEPTVPAAPESTTPPVAAPQS